MQTPKKTERLAHGSARERIVQAAATLFAQSGLDGFSFRDLAQVAGVSLSATHYYFASKKAILTEVFQRSARDLEHKRLAGLEEALALSAPQLDVHSILRAFVRPVFIDLAADQHSMFSRLLARLAVEQSDLKREILGDVFETTDRRFLEALQRAAPHLTLEDVQWRFHFLVGALVFTISGSGYFAPAALAPMDEHLMNMMVDSFAASFLAAPKLSAVQEAATAS